MAVKNFPWSYFWTTQGLGQFWWYLVVPGRPALMSISLRSSLETPARGKTTSKIWPGNLKEEGLDFDVFDHIINCFYHPSVFVDSPFKLMWNVLRFMKIKRIFILVTR